MKAPDKIYIPFYPNYDGIDTHLSDEWFEGKAIDHVEGWVEYIHKDALIEWVNRRLEEFRHIAEISNDVAADGEVNAFEELIDKLNSM